MTRTTTAKQNTFAKSLHDLGLAAWFGGSLMGAAGINPATGEIDNPADRTRVADAAWGRWTPVNLAAIVAHLIGGAAITWGNKSRLRAQKGVGTATTLKTGLTLGALGATAYSRMLGQRVMDAETKAAETGDEMPTEGATVPSPQTPTQARDAQRQLNMLQWAVPALTGALVILDAKMSEQQRPMAVARGVLRRVRDQV